MSPEEYAEALEEERRVRNDRARYEVREEHGGWLLSRCNGARQSWGVTRYVNQETAELAAGILNRLKEDEA
ncbi:hypothetical protein NPS70_16440 [Streptomyces sp. C10-9-1]|uniref:hypothetical protein n=1 Tax=Streptomyces sp. C10-9-1 TaxID=1859285 RepID=UPI002111CFB2|nr:hypothetical protein [Streptomyces sp. C10-9-1]MCQ6554775.1 hypothetical protein [Streptomyces sp. C10-9-1]